MYFVYVLRSLAEPRFYIGIAEDVEKRVLEHNAGKTKSTKGFRPWVLFFKEEFKTRTEARGRELYLKSGSGREYIKIKWTRSLTGYLPAGAQGSDSGRQGAPE